MEDFENEVIETETPVTEEVEQVEPVDEEWGDDLDFSDLKAEDDEDDEVIEFDVEADQPTEEPNVEPEAPEAEKPVDEQKDENADQRFSLKHMDEVKEVNRDEVIELAQKGMDYDRIRTERDTMKADYGQLQDYKALLNELAENSGTNIDDFVLGVRAKLMVAKGANLTEETALQQLKAKAAEKAATEQAEKSAAEEASRQAEAEKARKEADVQNFIATFPGVEAKDIPAEVWSVAKKTGNLTGAYSAYRIKQLEEQIATAEKNKKNEERSTGSRKTGGNSAFDNFDDLWNDGT